MKPHLQTRLDFAYLDKYLIERHRIEALWELVKPLKFPQRRRREDREIPKAA